jgi:hypothetical protein
MLKGKAKPPITAYNLVKPAGTRNPKTMLSVLERRGAENTKVFWNNSDNNIGAENYGLKGGGVKTSRPEPATKNMEFSGNLITRLAETPK